MKHTQDKNFSGIWLKVDNTIFRNCKFTDCQMAYNGGKFLFENCTFDGCVWAFSGSAGLTLTILGMLRSLGYDINSFIPGSGAGNA